MDHVFRARHGSCLVVVATSVYLLLAACSDHRVVVPGVPPPPPVAPVILETRSEIEVPPNGSTPAMVADAVLQDFDRDGFVDLAVSTLGDPVSGGTVEVFRGDGKGGFTPWQTLSVHYFPFNVRLGDVNADKAIDLFVLSSGLSGSGEAMATPELVVFQNDGSGNLTTTAMIPVGADADSFAVGDIGAPEVEGSIGAPDGYVDLIVSRRGSSSLDYFAGGPDASFSPSSIGPFVLPQSGSIPPSAAAAFADDLDGDGLLEVVATDTATGRVIVFSFDPINQVWSSAAYPVGANPVTMSVGDANADGTLDLVVSNADDQTLSLLLQDPPTPGQPPSFQVQTVPVGDKVAKTMLADLDGDQIDDLVLCAFERASVSIYPGPIATGVPTRMVLPPAVELPATGLPFDPEVGDVDGDGFPDFLVTGSGTPKTNLFTGKGSGRFVSGYNIEAMHPGPESLVMADFDGDGRSEAAVAGGASDEVVILGLPSGGAPELPDLQPLLRVSVGSNLQIAGKGDFDGDGQVDLAASTVRGLKLLINDSSAAGMPSFTMVPTDPTQVLLAGFGEFEAEPGDMDGDGLSDLVVTDAASDRLAVLRAQDPSFHYDTSIYTVGPRPSGLAVADFDRDGKLDVAVAMNGGMEIELLRGDGKGALTPTWLVVPVGGAPSYMHAAEFDGDRRPDLVVSNALTDEITVLRNVSSPGKPQFLTQTFMAGVVPTGLVAEDLNGDGAPDILVTSLRGNEVCVLVGNGNGTFGAPTPFPASYAAVSVGVGDVDGDGRPDVSVASLNAKRFAVYRNITSFQTGIVARRR